MLRIKTNNSLVSDHVENLYKNIQTRITRVIKVGGLKKKNTQGDLVLAIHLSSTDIIFLNKIKKDVYLKKLISASPSQLKKIIKLIHKYYPDAEDQTKDLYKCLFNIFVNHGYEKDKNINKYEFIQNIGLGSCPYCNRNYIYTLDKNRLLKAKIDHFYPKSLYPILAVSYFNLIPSCLTCNGLGAKGSKDTFNKYPLKNPYEIEPDDFIFDYSIKSMNILNPITNIDKNSIEILFDTHIKSHSDVFGLDLLYEENRDIVIELYLKVKHEYVKQHIKYLHSYRGLKFSDEEVYRFITCGYFKDEDLHKRPMSKLIKDISIKLELINPNGKFFK